MKAYYLLFLSLFSFCLIQGQSGQWKIGDTLSYSEIIGMKGERYDLTPYEGKVLVLNFWFIGCKGCEAERPYLNEVYQTYLEEDIQFLSITYHTDGELNKFLPEHPIDWEIWNRIDFMGVAGESQFNIRCYPTTLIIDRNRLLRYQRCGSILNGKSGDDFRDILTTVLKE